MFKKYIKPWAWMLFVLVMTGCAAMPDELPSTQVQQYKSVGVVSILGREFSRLYVGFTVFGNETESIDSTSWGLDEKYEQALASIISKEVGLKAVAGNVSRDEFAHLYDLNGPWDAPAFRVANWKAIAAPIKNYCDANQVDAVVVLFAGQTGGQQRGGSDQSVKGIGMLARGVADRVHMSSLYLSAAVGLVDCQNPNSVQVEVVGTPGKVVFGHTLIDPPAQFIPPDLARTPLQQLTPTQLSSIQNDLQVLPASSWTPTVRSLFKSRIKK